MRRLFAICSLLIILLGPILCAYSAPKAAAPSAIEVPFDQLPMYGGMDRSTNAALKEGDAAFIEGVTKQFGSREAAAKAWIDYGFRKYRDDDSITAMKRFNQAWLLDPKNPEVYFGFASVLGDRGEFTKALEMMEKAMSMGLKDAGFIADTGFLYTRAATDTDWPEVSKLSEAEKRRRLKRSEELFAIALSMAPSLAYVAEKRAAALTAQGRYKEAWAEVHRGKPLGADFPKAFLKYLKSNEPEPK